MRGGHVGQNCCKWDDATPKPDPEGRPHTRSVSSLCEKACLGGEGLLASNAIHQYILERTKDKNEGCKQENTTEEESALLGGKTGLTSVGEDNGPTGNKGYGRQLSLQVSHPGNILNKAFLEGNIHIEKCRDLKFNKYLKFG